METWRQRLSEADSPTQVIRKQLSDHLPQFSGHVMEQFLTIARNDGVLTNTEFDHYRDMIDNRTIGVYELVVGNQAARN